MYSYVCLTETIINIISQNTFNLIWEVYATTDNDECTGEGSGHDCDVNAACTNTDGGFTCECNGGWSGDGVTCTGNA